MKTYLILPEHRIYKANEWYFKKAIKFLKNNNEFDFIVCFKSFAEFNIDLHGLSKCLTHEVEDQIDDTDIVFDFFNSSKALCKKHYFLDISSVNCCLYSCLHVKSGARGSVSKTNFPVELLSKQWFEIIHAPDPDFINNKLFGAGYVNIMMPSEQRARVAYQSNTIMAECFISALEAILLGKKVNYPNMPDETVAGRDYYLSSRLLPSSVLTNKDVFTEFVNSIDSQPLVNDAMLESHHQSLIQDRHEDKEEKMRRKIRKLKRDPVQFIGDAFKKCLQKFKK